MYTDGLPCRICDRPRLSRENNLLFLPRWREGGHAFFRGWDGACVHRECFLDMPDLARFGAVIVEYVERDEPWTLEWSRVYSDGRVFVEFGQGRQEPESVVVHLRKTGTFVAVPLMDWAAWLERPTASHPVEQAAVTEAIDAIRAHLPDVAAVLAAPEDLNAKWKRIRERNTAFWVAAKVKEAERVRGLQNEFQDRERRFADWYARVQRDGVTCPFCRAFSRDFADTNMLRLRCSSCGRSAGLEDAV